MTARAPQRFGCNSAATSCRGSFCSMDPRGGGGGGADHAGAGAGASGACRIAARRRQDDAASSFDGEQEGQDDNALHRRRTSTGREPQQPHPDHRGASQQYSEESTLMQQGSQQSSSGRCDDPINSYAPVNAYHSSSRSPVRRSSRDLSYDRTAPRNDGYGCSSNPSWPFSTLRSIPESDAYCAAAAASSSSPSSTSPRSVVTLTAHGDDSTARTPPSFDPPFADGCRRDIPGSSPGADKARPIEIEIEPGLYSALRGSDETWEAILDDMYMPSQCPWCQLTVFAIQDCGYVLCPDCKAVFPVDDNDGGMINRLASGVGLGFTFESLLKWQPDVDECRRIRRYEQPQR